jgi:cytochrome c2
MNATLKFYAPFFALFALVSVVIGFNFAAWGMHRYPTHPVWHLADANPERGRALIRGHGCGACHVVPGIPGAMGRVGPRLDRVKEQIYVAGVLPHNPENLTFWIANPKQADPLTAMPDLKVDEAEARDIAAYLYSLP